MDSELHRAQRKICRVTRSLGLAEHGRSARLAGCRCARMRKFGHWTLSRSSCPDAAVQQTRLAELAENILHIFLYRLRLQAI